MAEHALDLMALKEACWRNDERAVYLWQDDFDTEVIERERPKVVIQEIKERRLISQDTLQDNPPILRAASLGSPAARPG